MSSLPDPEWQIQSNGQEYGPYARARILEMLACGELPDTAAIRQQGMPDWLPVPTARRLFQGYQATGGTLAEAQAPVQPAAPAAPAPSLDLVHAPESGVDGAEEDAQEEGGDDAVDLAPPPVAPVAAGSDPAADPAPPAAGARRATRSRAPLVYAAVAVLGLAVAGWFFGGSDPVGETGYATVKAELVERMDAWRDHGYRLESIPASAVDGPLLRYTIDPPGAPVGAKDASYTYVVHCTFRDPHGGESESKVTVTMGSRRLRLWNLFK